jgi:hypothetical protein
MHGNGMVAQAISSSHAALIHRIRAQELTPGYRQTATSTGNILVKANLSGKVSRVFTFFFRSRITGDELNNGDAMGLINY